MSKNFERASSYPLCWPEGWPKTKSRDSSQFKTTLFQALKNVEEELGRFAKDSGKKITEIIISSNFNLTDQNPTESGVAVYFTWDGERTCIPVDKYTKVQDNLQAIFHCISAKRTMLRHGGVNLVKAAFRGYAALPNPASDSWKTVLNYHGNSLADCKAAWRRAAQEHHPDRPSGSHDQAARVNAAWEQAQKELGQ